MVCEPRQHTPPAHTKHCQKVYKGVKEMKCYKVVTLDYSSYYIPRQDFLPDTTMTGYSEGTYMVNEWCLSYALNKITKKIKGTIGIFCFENIENIKSFLNYEVNNYHIFECIGYKELKYKEKKICSPGYINQFYNKNIPKKDRNMYIQFMQIPNGTILFDSIKPIKEIQK